MNFLRASLPPLATLLPFEAAARLESFSRAAEELNLTQAAVSRQIRALEEDLGTRLFERRNRSVFLTAAGRELSEVVSTALGRIAEQSNRSRGGRAENEVVLFCQLCEAIYWLMPRLDGFHQQHPEIELKLLTSTWPLTEAQDRFDVAIQTSGRASGQYPLAFGVSEEVFPVCSKIYLSKCAEPATLDRLADHHLLHHKATPRDWIEWDDWLVRVGQTVRVGIHGRVFDSYPLMLQAAIEGHGIALGWVRSAEKLLQSGALVRPFTESAVLPGELCVYLRDHDAPGPAVAALLAWLTTALAQ